jgi:hypothetical protein
VIAQIHQICFVLLGHLQAAHKEAMGGVERKLVEEKTRLQREAHAQLMEIKRNTDEEVSLNSARNPGRSPLLALLR